MARLAANVERTGCNQQRDMVCIQLDDAHSELMSVTGYYGALVMGGPLDAPNEIATGSVVCSRAYNSYADFVYRDPSAA